MCGDAERLPLADGSIDLILSNLMLQWCDPDRVFAEFRRVLAPNGLLTFTTLGPDTLKELRSAWGQVDSHTHVNQFIDMHDIGDSLVRNGFAAPVLDVERYTLSYLDVRKLAADLKATVDRMREGIPLRSLVLYVVLFIAVFECFFANRVMPALAKAEERRTAPLATPS